MADYARTVTWWKVPIIGVPGFQTCQMPKHAGTDIPKCGQDTLWVAGTLHVCRDHFPIVADYCGDTVEDIEAAWREHVS